MTDNIAAPGLGVTAEAEKTNTNDNTKDILQLWQHIFRDQQGFLCVWTCKPGGGLVRDAFLNYPDAADAAAEWALEKAREGREVYFCAHLLEKAKRIKEYAAEVRALWGDLDGTEIPLDGLTPTAVVESSPGRYHAYWLLEDPVPPEVAEQLNKRLADATGADPSGFDLSQLLRVPGTKNHKYPGEPLTRIVHLDESAAHSPRDLDERLPEVEEEYTTAPQVENRIADGKRNSELTSIAGTMRHRGLEEEELAAALLVVNKRRCDPPLGETEVRGIARSVARYEPGKVIPITVNGRNSHSHSPIGEVNVNEKKIHTLRNPKKDLRATTFAGREKPPPQEYVVEKLIPSGLATSLYGGGGLAKSVNVLHLGLSVAFVGVEEWHGLQVGTCPVIYLDFEMSETVQLRRAKEIADGAGWPDVPKNFHYVEAAGHETAEVFAYALELIEKYGPALVPVDSFGFSMQGESERSADVLSYARNYIQPLQEAGAHPLIVDHISRTIKGERAADKEAFGSVYKTNSMRSTINVTGHADEDTGVVYTTFTHRKSNVGPRHKPFTVITKFCSGAITFERSDTVIHPPTEETVEQLIASAIRENGPMTNSQIAAFIDRELRSVQNATSRLKSAGVLVETGEKREREAVLGLGEE